MRKVRKKIVPKSDVSLFSQLRFLAFIECVPIKEFLDNGIESLFVFAALRHVAT